MLHCMFDVADALGALQQALALPVDRLSGSWYWTLRHMAQPWGQVLAEVLLMADATVKHLQQPCEESASQLLIQVGGRGVMMGVVAETALRKLVQITCTISVNPHLRGV
eukprot:GHUV01046884.1.p1 GENE.GHUV01046884.1~~GHUV01046884.1.p1  ORF type:complete len:109 (+),score=29.44 GHUV01046884.1:432-758(+)